MKSYQITPQRLNDIREGWASAMILHGKHTDFDIGEQFGFATHTGGEHYMPIEAIVIKFTVLGGDDLSSDEFDVAYILDEWKGLLEQWPGAKREDSFTIVYFDLM